MDFGARNHHPHRLTWIQLCSISGSRVLIIAEFSQSSFEAARTARYSKLSYIALFMSFAPRLGPYDRDQANGFTAGFDNSWLTASRSRLASPPSGSDESPQNLTVAAFPVGERKFESGHSGDEFMAWYAYCITEQRAFQGENRVRKPFPIEGLRGIGGAQIIGFPSGEFAVIASEYLKRGTLEQRAALEHAFVLSECFKHGTVLPFKFATIFDNEESIRFAVKANRRIFLQCVSQLRGKSEMHLKVVVPESSMAPGVCQDCEVPAVVGAEYLSKLRIAATRERERQTKARAVSQQVHKLFDPLDEDVSCKHHAGGGLTIGIAHLIENDSVPKYQNRFSTASKQFKDCELAISGPWPPFHFLPEKLRTV